MSRIEPVNHERSTGKTKELLDAVQSKLGMTPNLMKTMAHSPAVLEAYLTFNATLGTTLTAKLREQIAVLTAEENGCGYCAAAHSAFGAMAGLDGDAILAARAGNSEDPKTRTALKFARQLILNRGKVTDDDMQTIKTAGYTDGEINEIVAHVALNTFTNYFNETAKTEIDFPAIEFPLKTRSAKA